MPGRLKFQGERINKEIQNFIMPDKVRYDKIDTQGMSGPTDPNTKSIGKVE